MLTRLGGGQTPSLTEKHSPCACPGPWYGSWPRITTRTCSSGVRSSARNHSEPRGKICFPRSRSAIRKRLSSPMYGCSNSPRSGSSQLGWRFIFSVEFSVIASVAKQSRTRLEYGLPRAFGPRNDEETEYGIARFDRMARAASGRARSRHCGLELAHAGERPERPRRISGRAHPERPLPRHRRGRRQIEPSAAHAAERCRFRGGDGAAWDRK